jgi:hypothetical protein
LQNRTESFQKPVSIGIVFKNISSLDTPAYDMMQGTWSIYYSLTWYVTSLPQKKNKTPFGRIKSETELIEYAYPFDLELSDFLYLLYHIQMGRLWKDRISLHT